MERRSAGRARARPRPRRCRRLARSRRRARRRRRPTDQLPDPGAVGAPRGRGHRRTGGRPGRPTRAAQHDRAWTSSSSATTTSRTSASVHAGSSRTAGPPRPISTGPGRARHRPRSRSAPILERRRSGARSRTARPRAGTTTVPTGWVAATRPSSRPTLGRHTWCSASRSHSDGTIGRPSRWTGTFAGSPGLLHGRGSGWRVALALLLVVLSRTRFAAVAVGTDARRRRGERDTAPHRWMGRHDPRCRHEARGEPLLDRRDRRRGARARVAGPARPRLGGPIGARRRTLPCARRRPRRHHRADAIADPDVPGAGGGAPHGDPGPRPRARPRGSRRVAPPEGTPPAASATGRRDPSQIPPSQPISTSSGGSVHRTAVVALELERRVRDPEPLDEHLLQLVAARLGLVQRGLTREHHVGRERRGLGPE